MQNASNSPPTDQQINQLTSRRYKSSRNTLDLQNCPEHWVKVLKSGDWSSLQLLILNKCNINDLNIGVFEKVRLNKLERLRAWGNKITEKGMAIFLRNQLPALTTIAMYDNLIGDIGLQLLLYKLQHNLITLGIGKNNITCNGIKCIMDSSINLKKIAQMNLSENCIGSRGIKILTKAQLPQLQLLWIQCCGIGAEGCKALVKSNWKNLNQLNISINRIGITGQEYLAISNWLKLQIFETWEQDEKTKITHTQAITSQNFVLFQKIRLVIETGYQNQKLQRDLGNVFLERFANQRL